MLSHRTGNLLDTTANYICHQVNCRGVMGSGVAKQIKNKWPVAYTKYVDKVREREEQYLSLLGDSRSGTVSLLGETQFVDIGNNQKVVNMFAQQDYGYDGVRYTSYDAFEKCLQDIKRTAAPGSTIAFPYKIGSDRGGANWNIIEKMIDEILGFEYTVLIYHLEETPWL